jgi:fatty-acyl-CoA synthase
LVQETNFVFFVKQTFIYVGEICRYLVNQPPSEFDKKHSIKVAIGNGLRSNVWQQFYDRFGIRALEFYAASEGNCITCNYTAVTVFKGVNRISFLYIFKLI